MAKIRLGKTKDSRTRGKAVDNEEETRLLQKILDEKEQPGFKVYLLRKGFSRQTIKGYQIQLRRYQKWLEKENLVDTAVSYNDIVFYIQGKRERVSQRTIQSETNVIKHYYNHLKQIGSIKENPVINVQVKGVKRRKLYNVLNKKELEELFNDYRSLEVGKGRNRERQRQLHKIGQVVLSLVVYQGLTTTELKRLKLKDVRLREGILFVAGTRRSNERNLKLEAHQVMDLMEYQLSIRGTLEPTQESELFFSDLATGKRFHNELHKMLKQLNGLQPKLNTLKQIRVSVINVWLRMYNLREVQYMAGHRYVSSTEAYLVNDLEDLSNEIDKYHPL